MAVIIGNIAAGIGFISAFITMFYNNATTNKRRTLQWLGVTFIAVVIMCATIPFQ